MEIPFDVLVVLQKLPDDFRIGPVLIETPKDLETSCFVLEDQPVSVPVVIHSIKELSFVDCSTCAKGKDHAH
jgi:hypothetical protein